MRVHARIGPVLAVCTAFAATPRAQQVWAVGNGGQFATIGAAVAAASDGDILLVGAGSYPPFVIDGKGLHVIGANAFVSNSATPIAAAPPAVTIRNLAPGQHVHLSGMQVFCFAEATADLLVHDCAGTVWLEKLFCDSYGAPALVVERCGEVVLADVFAQTNLTVASPAGIPQPGPGGRFVDSGVRAYDCRFHGSHGVLQGPGLPAPVVAPDGGNGIEVVGSAVTLNGCEADGAGGGSLVSGSCLFVGNGGHGALLQASAVSVPQLRHRDSAFHGGFLSGTPTCGPTPSPGVAILASAGQPVALPGTARALRGGGAFAAPALLAVEVAGEPGDAVFVFAGATQPAVDVLGLSIHIGPALIALGAAVADAQGQVKLPIQLPASPSGAPPFVGALQAAVLSVAGDLTTSGPAVLVVH